MQDLMRAEVSGRAFPCLDTLALCSLAAQLLPTLHQQGEAESKAVGQDGPGQFYLRHLSHPREGLGLSGVLSIDYAVLESRYYTFWEVFQKNADSSL